MEDVKKLQPRAFTRFCMSIAQVPSSYISGLTMEEQLLWFCSYLQNEVIPAVNNNAGAVEELQALYVQLKDYVDHYFDNLDVQEEVNNKLDEMAESGQLTDIIAQYLQLAGVLAYDTLADMKAAENLINGSIAKTLGFHSYNDKGGCFYKIRTIRNDDVVDNISIISITNTQNLVAELIEQPEMFVNQYGAYGDGTHDDTTAIQYAIEKHTFGTIHIPEGTYLISSPLKTYVDNIKQCNIDMERTTIIKTNNNLDCLIELGGLGGNNIGYADRTRYIKGGILDAENCNNGIIINSNAMGIEILNVEIKNFSNHGIYSPVGSTIYPSDLLINNCHINGKGSENNNYGLYLERSDNKIINSRINACNIGTYLKQGGNIINNIHILGIGNVSNWYNNTIGIEIYDGSENIITNSYIDTMQTIVKSSSIGSLNFINNIYYSYEENLNTKLFIFNSDKANYIIKNNQFSLPINDNKNQGIIYNTFNQQFTTRTDISIINNNKIINSSTLKSGDLILKNNNTYSPFYLGSNNTLKNDEWLHIGYIIGSNFWNDIELNVEGVNFRPFFKVEDYGGTAYVECKSSISSVNDKNISFGFNYEHADNGYPVYSMYVKQTTGNLLKTDISIKQNNNNSSYIPLELNNLPANPSYISTDPDYIFSL